MKVSIFCSTFWKITTLRRKQPKTFSLNKKSIYKLQYIFVHKFYPFLTNLFSADIMPNIFDIACSPLLWAAYIRPSKSTVLLIRFCACVDDKMSVEYFLVENLACRVLKEENFQVPNLFACSTWKVFFCNGRGEQEIVKWKQNKSY